MFPTTSLLIGFGAGYVLGSRAGRERYEQIMTQVRGVAGSPAAQEKASALQQQATEVAGKAKGSATEAASKAKDKIAAKSGSSDDDTDLSNVDTARYTASGTSR